MRKTYDDDVLNFIWTKNDF